MSWGEEEQESTFDAEVTCNKCRKKYNYWDCLISHGRTICEYCSTPEEIKEHDELQATARKNFEYEMERLRRRYSHYSC